MTRLRLTLACWDYDRTRALIDGTIQPNGIDLVNVVLPPMETFTRMLRFREFHVSEMSLASYTILKAQGKNPFTAIPVFLSRFFRHSCIYINTASGIQRPEDLVGKRIGVPQYQFTAAVFARGMLHHDYGVTPESVQWLWGGQEEPNSSNATLYTLPENIRLELIPTGKTLSQMLEQGEIDALITPFFPSPFLNGSPNVKRLFESHKEIETDYYRRTGIFPIMHTVVIRNDVLRENPWVTQSLYQAFVQAKARAEHELYETDALKVMLPWMLDAVEETWSVMGRDFWPYGVESNRTTLCALMQYLVEQGLIERAIPIEELFYRDT